jgi:hypothetical protein
MQMKLTPAQVQETLSQYDAEPIPDNHRLLPRLNEWFGDHTFFLDSNGLSIVEPAGEVPHTATRSARVVSLAHWSDDACTKLAGHRPEPTDTFLSLGSRH